MRFLGDESLARAVVAVFGGVGDGISHCRKAALVDEVDDELHLVNALKVSHLGLIARFDERFKARFHELGHAAAEHCLLAEEVGLGLFAEGGLENARSARADAAGVSERDLFRLARIILRDGDKGRNALALEILRTDGVTRSLGRYHDDVDVLGGLDEVEMYVQAVRERQRLTLGHIGSDFRLIYIRAKFVGDEHHHHVRLLGCLGNAVHFESVFLGDFDVPAAFAQTDHDVNARIFEVHGVCVTLRAEADDGDRLAVENFHVAISVVILFDHFITSVPLGQNVFSFYLLRFRRSCQCMVTMSSIVLPAGIMGKTISSRSMTASMTTGLSFIFTAFSSAAFSSSSVVHLKPTPPNASASLT